MAGVGIPNILWRGMDGTQIITITECLGPNLKKLFLLMEKKFSVPTVAMIAIQVLNTLEYIHKHDYVCCNVMPKEILISLHKTNMTLYITDFKQAKKVKNGRIIDANNDTNHLANRSILNKFSSVNLHLGLTPSTKDDLESLGYILIYFLKEGNLFEKTPKTSNKEEKIKFYEQQKLFTIPEALCLNLPSEMATYMSYVKSIQSSQINDKIDYDYLKKLFRNLFLKTFNGDPSGKFRYDWIKKAKIYNSDTQSKGTDRGGLENSFIGLDGTPISLIVGTNKDLRDGSVCNTNNPWQRELRGGMSNRSQNNNNSNDSSSSNLPTEQIQPKPTLNGGLMNPLPISIIDNSKNSPIKENIFKLPATENPSELDCLNGDYLATDVQERLDNDDTIQKKFDNLRMYSREIKSIEYIKSMYRSGFYKSFHNSEKKRKLQFKISFA